MKTLCLTLAVALVAIVAIPSVAQARSTPGVDNAYRVTGDPQAAPVQAFSVGETLYLQLRDTKQVPAPIGVDGPIPYRIYGPYMILPVVRSVTLHYGNYTAYVVGADGGTESADTASTTATLTAPEDAVNAQTLAPPRYAAPTYASAPVFSPPPRYAPPAPAAADQDAVVGTIGGTSMTGAGQGFAPVTPATTRGNDNDGRITGPQSDSRSLLARLGTRPGGTVLIVADGTVAGATAATSTMQACMNKHWACQVQYKGAPAGQLTLEMAR